MSQQTQNVAGPSASSASAKRTPAQREKKRAQDRQSQRNVRNRTKQHIAALEARVNELSSYEGLSHLIAANEALQARNDELVTALRSIATLVEKVCGSVEASSKSTDNKAVDEKFRSPSWVSPSESPEGQTHTQRGSMVDNVLGQEARRTSYHHNSQAHRIHSISVPSPRSREQHLGVDDSTRDYLSAHVDANSTHAFETRTYPIHHSRMESETGHDISNGPNFTSQNPWTSQIMSPPTGNESNIAWDVAQVLPQNDLAASSRHPFAPSTSEVTNTPKSQICPPTNIWDAKLTAFIRHHRTSSSPEFAKQVAEPSSPIVDMLVYSGSVLTSSDPIVEFLAGVMNPWNFRMPERLAFFYLNYIFIKWAIAPTPANTRHLPDWFLPKPPQSETSHPLYVDTIPWPEMRNKITFHCPTLDFPGWVTQFCHNLNVSWKHDPSLCFTTDFPEGTTRISPALHSHLRELSNWTLDPPFAVAYPFLALKE